MHLLGDGAIVQTAIKFAPKLSHDFNGLGSNATMWHIDNAQQGSIVFWVGEHTAPSHNVFDLHTGKEAGVTGDLAGNMGTHQGLFHIA